MSTDEEEMQKQFKARPMPRYAQPLKRKSTVRVATAPEPFNFATERTSHRTRDTFVDEDEVELAKQFKAQPSPKSTWVAPSTPSRSKDSASVASSVVSLRSAERAEKRAVAVEASRRKAARLAQEKEIEKRVREREKHIEAILQSEHRDPSLTRAKPFNLRSSRLHERFVRKTEEKRDEERAEAKRSAVFRAKKYTTSPPEPDFKPRLQHRSTAPEPFNLNTVTRHAAYESEREQRLEEEKREQRRATVFKSKPVPKSTYEYKPKSPLRREVAPPTFDEAPQLHLSDRLAARKAFDEKVRKEREEEEARQRAMDEQRAAEEEEELQELRRLPSNEGGFNPVANPIRYR